MNKRLILSVLAITLLSTCKKEKTAEIDAVGTYTLSSHETVGGSTFTTATNPCLADNLLILKADNSSAAFYKGTSPCTVSSGVTIGTADTIKSIWSVKNNKIFFRGKQNGEVATVDGKLQLTLRDTITLGGSGIMVKVFKKQ
jgi:hypothetical protein